MIQDDFERTENMRYQEKNINMLSGSLYKSILLFTIPIALSSMLQQLFNAADTAIVGFFDTASSLAAVGTNGEIIALIVSLSSGLSIGVNVMIAQQIGQHKENNLTSMIQTAMSLAIMIGILGLIFGQCIATPVLTLIKTPPDILNSSILYLRIYFVSYPFLMLYDFGSAILRAYGNSRYPFIALTLSGIVNVFLNLIFVVFFQFGVFGVAVATAISTMFSAILVIFRLKKEISVIPFSLKKCDMQLKIIVTILRIGIPSAVQSAVFCFANIFVQACVNGFGSYAIAGSTIAMNFEYFTYYVITAFGQTATTFTSQNHSAGQYQRCKKILWVCLICSIVSSMILIEPLVIFRNFFAGFFSTNKVVIKQACLRIMCILFFEPLCNLYEIPAGVLRGSRHSLYPAVATIVGTCCFRILWICTVFLQYHELNILYYAFPISWVLTILLIVTGFILIRPFN